MSRLARATSKEKIQLKLLTTLLTKMHKKGCQNTQLKGFPNKLYGKLC